MKNLKPLADEYIADGTTTTEPLMAPEKVAVPAAVNGVVLGQPLAAANKAHARSRTTRSKGKTPPTLSPQRVLATPVSALSADGANLLRGKWEASAAWGKGQVKGERGVPRNPRNLLGFVLQKG
jgi:hypothetical protein